MKVCTFFSGSKGNVTLVRSRDATVLIDCGKGQREIERCFTAIGESIADVDAILVTHEHADHVYGLTQTSNSYDIPIYVHERGAAVLADRVKANPAKICPYTEAFDIKDLHIDFMKLSHDADYCAAYAVTSGDKKFSIVTDTGVLPVDFSKFVRDSGLLLLESNHDTRMLLNGPYAPFLKRRIFSGMGHLSNEQAAQAIKILPALNVREVWLGHISQENNSAELVFASAVDALSSVGAVEGKDIKIDVIYQGKRSSYINVR